jgi:hypothetical protein
MAARESIPLAWFETPRALIEPTLRVLRLSNTALDTLFYDVNVLWTELLWRGTAVVTTAETAAHATRAFEKLDLGALSNPEGSILVVDASREPFVTRFDDVPGFLRYTNNEGRNVRAASITGVGSSALGSAAFAWNLSVALGHPVAAIVPGYGIADVVQQSLGGWFGFGLTSWVKKLTQEMLARMAPETARIGRGLMMTAPDHAAADTGAPVFRRGSGSSDVLHSILRESDYIEHVFGHSKGALSIGNALHDLPEAITERLRVTTFGCPIEEDAPGAAYLQILGLIDPLGLLNSWGNRPEVRPLAHHSTNTAIPLSMPVSLLTRLAEAKETPQAVGEPARIAAPSAAATMERIGVALEPQVQDQSKTE